MSDGNFVLLDHGNVFVPGELEFHHLYPSLVTESEHHLDVLHARVWLKVH